MTDFYSHLITVDTCVKLFTAYFSEHTGGEITHKSISPKSIYLTLHR